MDKKKKKVLIVSLSIVGVIILAVVITLSVLLTRKPEKPPVQEGAIYQTESKIIWSGVAGVAYISFEYVEEPETPEEGQLYGYVFKVMADGSTDVTKCTPWLTGKWELEENNGTYGELKLTAMWDDNNDDATKLTNATSGEAKTYTLDGDVYKIEVSFSAGANLTFTMNPNTKLSGNERPSTPCSAFVDIDGDGVCDNCGHPAPSACTEFIDANNDGLCDNCGHALPGEKNIILEAADTTMGGFLKAKIHIIQDSEIWRMTFAAGDTAQEIGTGTYVEETGKFVMTVDTNPHNMIKVDTFDVAIDNTDPEGAIYTCDLVLVIQGGVGDMGFSFTGREVAAEPEPDPLPPAELTVSLNGKADIMGFMESTATIEIYDNDTFKFKSMFGTVISGACEEIDSGDIILTADGFNQTITALSGGIYTLTCAVTESVPTAGNLSLNYVFVSEAQHFTVTLDLNYGETPNVYMTKETCTFNVYDWSLVDGVMVPGSELKGVKEYLDELPVPTRLRYKFAGWHFDKNPTIQNGVSAVQYLPGEKINMQTAASYTWEANDVMGITEDTTLYARWVKATYISTPMDFQNIKNDLNGWYVLRNDIDLSGVDWNPIGDYVDTYELYNTDWWVRSFHGLLDGRGYTIKNLSITELNEFGTAALFGTVADCTVKNLTISDAKIKINDTPKAHAYISVLAAFVQGMNSVFDNCHVVNAEIDVTLTNAWYPSVAGLFGGHWGGIAQYCSVTGTTINVKAIAEKGWKADSVNIYVGGLVGEGYVFVEFCKAEADITLTIEDSRVAADFPAPLKDDTDGSERSGGMNFEDFIGGSAVNVYLGGAMASSTYLTNLSYTGKITLNYTQGAGTAGIHMGGISGYQRYGYIKNCFAKATMEFVNNNIALIGGQTFSQGGILGTFDTFMGLLGVSFNMTGCRVTNSLDLSTFTEKTNIPEETKVFNVTGSVGTIPDDAIVRTLAPVLGIDLGDYTVGEGDAETLNFFGIFDSVYVDGDNFSSETDMYGDAIKTILGSGWVYADGALPTCN